MRTTQFIGLTAKATEFTEKLVREDSDTATFGMFDEEIPLGKWSIPPAVYEEHPYLKGAIVREVVQAAPWSSGPMIFTCLKLLFPQDEQEPDLVENKIFQWIDNPLINGFDRIKGEFFV